MNPIVPNRKITIAWDQEKTNKIACIKAVRAATGFGLKEAKNLVESAAIFQIEATHERLDQTIADLRHAGMNVTITDYAQYTDGIKELVTMATLKGDYYVAKILINLLEERF